MRFEEGWSWPSVPQDASRAQGVVILGAPPRLEDETPDSDYALLGHLLSVDPGLVGYFLVSDADHDVESMTSMRRDAGRNGWNLAVIEARGSQSLGVSGLILAPAGAEPHRVDVGRLRPSANPIEIALEVMRPDLVVASFGDRSWPTIEHPNLVSVRDGTALASLHLRRRGVFLLEATRGSSLRTDKGSFYRVGAKGLVPALGACHAVWKTAWSTDVEHRSSQSTDDLVRIGSLLMTVEQRLLRTLQARDRLRWNTDYLAGNQDDVHLDLDSVLLALQGAVDAAVRAINIAAGVGRARRGSNLSWRNQQWVSALHQRWPSLASLYSDDQNVRDAVKLLGDFRNRIHSDSWGYVRHGRADQAPHELEIWIRCDDEKVPEFRSRIERLGGRERWRWSDIDQSCMFLDPVSLVEELIALITTFLNSAIAQMATNWQKDLDTGRRSVGPELDGDQATAAEWWKQRETATVLRQLGVRQPRGD